MAKRRENSCRVYKYTTYVATIQKYSQMSTSIKRQQRVTRASRVLHGIFKGIKQIISIPTICTPGNINDSTRKSSSVSYNSSNSSSSTLQESDIDAELDGLVRKLDDIDLMRAKFMAEFPADDDDVAWFCDMHRFVIEKE
jgi:transposase